MAETANRTENLLRGKTSVVTGANRGIGRAILERFAQSGSHVWACTRTLSDEFHADCESLAKQFDVSIRPVSLDLIDSESVKAAAKTITQSKEPVDALVNNAGAIHVGPFQMTSMDKIREMFEVNFFSQIQFSQLLTRYMVRQRSGSVINLSSSAGIEGNEGRIGYAPAKAAVINATKVMARELSRAGIRVNAIAPGLTQTEMMTSSTSEEAIKDTLARTCMNRIGEPVEIADAALFLASNLSSFMTMQVLCVDGGM